MSFRSTLASYRRPPLTEARFWLVQTSTVGVFALRELLNRMESGHAQVVPPFAILALFSLPILYAALNFGFYGSVVTAGVATLLAGWAMDQDLAMGNPLSAWAESAQIVIIDIVGTLVGHFQEVATTARRQVAGYAARLVESQEEERRRIARELHDEPIQVLAQLCRLLESDKGNGKMLEARLLIEGVAANLRDIAEGLRPAPLDDLGLVAAVDRLVRKTQERSDLQISLTVDGEQADILPDVELALFRIAQEAITNALRHAEATAIDVRLAFGRSGLELTIGDDGKGFDGSGRESPPAEEGPQALGLVGMRERATSVGSRLEVSSTPGSGTRVTVRVGDRGPVVPAFLGDRTADGKKVSGLRRWLSTHRAKSATYRV